MKNGAFPLLTVCWILSAIIVTACAAGHQDKPGWYYRPNKTGNIGGVGISGPHVKGANAQRELAISRAVDEIARQKGITVKNVLEIVSAADRHNNYTRYQAYSIHTVTGEILKAQIAEVWKNPETNKLYVWMVVK